MVKYMGHVMNAVPGYPEHLILSGTIVHDLLHDYKEGWKIKVILNCLSMPITFHVL